MTLFVLCSVVVLVLHTQAWRVDYTEIGRQEGEECHREAGEVWTCKKDNECEELKNILKAKGSLMTCSWEDRAPILCCPPNKQLELDRLQRLKSKKKCEEYEDQLCGVRNPPQIMPEPAWNPGKPSNEEYIFGGKPASPSENHHMALIGFGDPGSIRWECGGTLVSESFVMTAAHCVNTSYGLPRWVRLGELDIKSDTDEARPQDIEIVKHVVHPEYRPPAFYNDLALLRLSRSVVFGEHLRPACIDTDLSDPTGVGTAKGWGKIETNGPKSSVLMKVDIKFVPGEDCKQAVGLVNRYLPNGINTETMLCAGELGKDTCQGDSGGPLIIPPERHPLRNCLARLVGVTSFGPKNCGLTTIPGAYVRVAYFLPWIESVIWPN